MLKLNFKVSPDFEEGIKRLGYILNYEIGEGITVTAKPGDRIGVTLKNGEAIIYYKQKNHFWRELSVLTQNAAKSDEFDITEDGHFDTLGFMICVSRGMVPTVKTLKKCLDYLAVMGYNLVMLQTDDLFEMDKRPYFGYMRGRYTKDELRAFDDYAHDYGIEAIPCIECYGHMKTYLLWPEASAIKDTASVLLAREEKTFEFVEEMIRESTSCFRSKRIHIGMDEAWDMGRGNFLTKHGLVHMLKIFNEYMERIISITNKYSLKPMMWSDMYFRCSRSDNAYYSPDTVIPDETKNIIPKEVELIFWNYGEEPECDYYMLDQHKTLDRPIISCGGLWEWIGHFPNNDKSFRTTKFSIEACRAKDVRSFMTTTWFIDSECDLFASLLGLSYTASLVYNKNADEVFIKERFEAETNGSYDAFYLMTRYHNKGVTEQPKNVDSEFLGKHLFWQDVMEGLFDTYLFDDPMSQHYTDVRDKMKKFRNDSAWDYLYEYCELVFDFLETKCFVGENLVPAYKRNDKSMLSKIAGELLPCLKTKAQSIHNAYREIWFKYNKDFGFVNNDYHYGGMCARIDYAILRLNAYLSGETECLDELEEERLKKNLWAFSPHSMIASVTHSI